MHRVGTFEKVSLERYLEDMKCNGLSEEEIKEMYNRIKLPRRATKGSAGYDFFAPYRFCLTAGMGIKIPTGIRVRIEDGWFLACMPRSSLGFKYRFQLDNTVPVIDSDYYYSDNEGHIFLQVTMDAKTDRSFSPAMTVEQGSAFVQGIFLPYGVTTDDDTDGVRNGGFGSTDMSTSNKEVVYNASGDSGIRS